MFASKIHFDAIIEPIVTDFASKNYLDAIIGPTVTYFASIIHVFDAISNRF